MVRATTIALVLLASCQPEVVTESPLPLGGDDTPTAVLDDAGVWVDGPWMHVEGIAADDDQPPWTLQVDLASSLDGDLWTGRPDADGHWSWVGAPSAGEHTLTATVTDAEGNFTSVEHTVTFERQNRPPSCAIISPGVDAIFASGQPVVLTGAWEDRDGDEVRLTWTSNVEGPLFIGESWDPILSGGHHLITLKGLDGEGGSCVDEVGIFVGE